MDFSTETFYDMRGWDDICKVLKKNKTANEE
jgi:hypothetical protein